MLLIVKNSFFKIISFILLVAASIGMVHYKQLIERSSNKVYEAYFFIFQTLFFSVLGYLFVAWIYKLIRNYRLLKNEKTEAELSLLKSKIDPHFFFNTLNNLYGLAIAKSDKTPEVILKLSEIMRYTIYEGEKELTPLKNEISYLVEYIGVQEIRYQKSVDIKFEKDVQDDSLFVSPLLFIMLVENAFKHGIESLAKDAFVHIELMQQDDRIIFEVSNNFEPKSETTSGMGLKNLKKRLQYLYPNRHSLDLIEDGNVYRAKMILVKK